MDPAAYDRERELSRFYWKVDAGAEFALTPPVFDVDALKSLIADLGQTSRPLIASIWPLNSAREAEFFEHEMADVPVPEPLVKRMQQAEKKGTEAEEGLAIARELALAVRPLVHGVQLIVAAGRVDAALGVLDAF